jgi:hypothetical protein
MIIDPKTELSTHDMVTQQAKNGYIKQVFYDLFELEMTPHKDHEEESKELGDGG